MANGFSWGTAFRAPVLGVMGALATLAAAAAPGAERVVDVSPERLWRAVIEQPELDAGSVDGRRFRAEVRAAPDVGWTIDVDWDERSGGAVLRSVPHSAAAEAWAERVAARAQALPHINKYCRGPTPDLTVPEPSIDAAHSCDHGNFSSAIHELEKCGDHETTLRLLATCLRSGHAAGLIRIAQLYQTGMGVPQRDERATHFLALASRSATPGYARSAKVLYATALYFGEGVPADKPAALALFRQAAAEGDRDASLFLAEGWHAAARRLDGTLYRDPDYHP